jgi:eubacterial secY protein.
MILVRALQANIEMLGALLTAKLGTVTTAETTAEGVRIVYTGYQSWLGTFLSSAKFDAATGAPISATSPQPVSGLMYYLSPIHGPSDWIPSMVSQSTPGLVELGINPIAGWQIWLHLLTDTAFLIIGGIIFAIFWIETTGMGRRALLQRFMHLASRYRDTGEARSA